MNSFLRIYNRNLLKNCNFTDVSNTQYDTDGITEIPIWDLGTYWLISGGRAYITNGDPAYVLSQDNVMYPGTDYKVIINIHTISGNLNIEIGSTVETISSTGVHEFTANSENAADYHQIRLYTDAGDDVSINWIKLVEAPGVEDIDLMNPETVALTYNIADIKDISKKNTSFSKTITIPGNKNNNRIFTSIFEIASDSKFNPNKAVQCELITDGIIVFTGILQLKNIKRQKNGISNYDYIEYELNVIGSLADIMKQIGDMKLTDLDLSEYNHVYNFINIQNSWNCCIVKNGVGYNNFTQSTAVNITAFNEYVDADGYWTEVTTQTAHGFTTEGDVVFLNSNNTPYAGDHIIRAITSTTTFVINFPYDYTFTANVFYGNCWTNESYGEGYVYPMIHYGTVGSSTPNNFSPRDFFPAVYLKTYIDKIFKKTGYTYTSSLFDSEKFKRLIIPYNGLPSEFKLINAQLEEKLFNVRTNADQTRTFTLSPQYNNAYMTPVYSSHVVTSGNYTNYTVQLNEDNVYPYYDGGNDFNIVTHRWVAPSTGYYSFNFTGKAKLELVQSLTAYGCERNGYILDYPRSTIVFLLRNVTLGTTIMSSQRTFSFPDDDEEFFDVVGQITNAYVTAGHVYELRVEPRISDVVLKQIGSSAPYLGDIQMKFVIGANSTLKNTVNSNDINIGDTIEMNYMIPKEVLAKDLLLSVFKMFNCFVETDPNNDNNLIIEPRDDYYDMGSIIDWTDKLDLSQDLSITPMGELNAKYYNFKYKDDKDVLNADHLAVYGLAYGNYEKEIDNDFITGTNDVQVIFSPSVLADIPSGGKRIVSDVTTKDTNGNIIPVASNIRIMQFYNASCYGTQWFFNQNGTNTAFNWYPYAGHLDRPSGPTKDINWWYPRGVYFEQLSWTSDNLFNSYYRKMINEITNKNSKIITCNIYLKPSDIRTLKFNNIYRIDKHYLRLNKIIDYSLGTSNSSKCEFIKIEEADTYQVIKKMAIIANLRYFIGEDEMPTKSGSAISTSGSSLYNNIKLVGSNVNACLTNSYNISAEGQDISIGCGSSDITIIGSSNVTVDGGLTNVTVVNTDNLVITESNVSYINGIKMDSNGNIINTNLNFIDACQDIVLLPFSANNINIIDAGVNNVLGFGSITSVNNIDAGEDTVL